MGIKRTPERTTQKKITEFTRKRPASDDGTDQPAQKSNRTGNIEDIEVTVTAINSLNNIVHPNITNMSGVPQNVEKSGESEASNEKLDKILAALAVITANTANTDARVASIQESFEKTKEEVRVITHRVGTLEETLTRQEEVIMELRRENEFLRKKSKENNLIFFGVKEPTNESPSSLKDELVNKLQEAGVSDLSIDFVHRMGVPKQGKTRAIKMRLVKLSDKSRILNAKKKLKNVFVQEDHPPETLKIHKTIEAFVKLTRTKGQSALNKGHFAIIDKKIIYHEEAERIMKESIGNDGTTNNQMDTHQ